MNAADLRYLAKRRTLTGTVHALIDERRRDLKTIDSLLTSIFNATRDDAECIADLCLVGSAWVMSQGQALRDYQELARKVESIVQSEEPEASA